MDWNREEEIKELVDFAKRYLPDHLRPRPPPPPPPPLSDSEIQACRDRINTLRDRISTKVEAARLLKKMYDEKNSSKVAARNVKAKPEENFQYAKESDVDEKLTRANIKISRHESSEEDKEPPSKRPCV
ncbi:hypothetical protein AALP_AA8G017000 [Arabis alpina]|uniref:Uncharacterized protein n=1 Tax=Arabis alpina TaxID=50452 RepID=A0A087G4C7_ARAAL|nr:hypothetical protein AALP_AA8G017000 [Arabis alpina]